MKKLKLITLVLLLMLGKAASAQQSPLQLMSQELRQLFSNVANPHPWVKFMYDLSGHIVDSSFFNHYVTDTSNAEHWFSIYQEQFYMAYDTTQVLAADSVYNLIKPKMQSDTIPIALIDWDFNLLNDTALTKTLISISTRSTICCMISRVHPTLFLFIPLLRGRLCVKPTLLPIQYSSLIPPGFLRIATRIIIRLSTS